MTSLYALTGQYQQLAQKLSEQDFDVTTVADTMEASGLPEAIQDKAQGVVMVARSAVAYVPAIDAEIERLQALKAKHLKLEQSLYGYVFENMRKAEIFKIECPLFDLSLKKNSPAVEVLDVKLIPASYMRTPTPAPVVAAPDKALIAKDLKAGKEIAGVRLVQGMRLVIA